MKNLITFILIIHCFTKINGQKNYSNLRSGQMYNYHPIFSSNTNAFQSTKRKIEGSRFVLNDFEKNGKVFIKGQAYTTTGLNIDILNNDVVFKLTNDSILILEKSVIDSLNIGVQKFKKKTDNTLYEVLWQKKDKILYKTYSCHVQKGHTNVMKGTTENDKYKIYSLYYFKKKGSMEEIFQPNKKAIINLLGKNQKQVKKFIKSNNLNIKSDQDLIKVLDYFY